jgi:hypothetical protein
MRKQTLSKSYALLVPFAAVVVTGFLLFKVGCTASSEGRTLVTPVASSSPPTPIVTLKVIPLDSSTTVTIAPLASLTPSIPIVTLEVIPLDSPTPVSIRAAPSSNEDYAYIHLYGVMDRYSSGSALRLLDSYESTATWDDGDTAWVYDNALVMLASMARGTAPDWERAKVLADSLVYAQNNDAGFADGRVRDAYSASSLVGTNGKAQIASPGSATGNMAWTMIAWLAYWKVKGGTSYLNAAVQLGEWICNNTYDTRGAGGYTGGYGASLEKYQWKATEHNLDVYVAFMKLYEATGNPIWFGRARHAKNFVRAMWDQTGGHFWTGTTNDGVTFNPSPIPEDAQSWGLMTLSETGTFGAGITWAENNLRLNTCASCTAYHGWKFSDVGNGCWFEGTAQMAVAYQIQGDDTKADDIVQVLRNVQALATNNDNAGIVAACPDGADTGYGWSYPNALHIGATAWYLFAERDYNPYWQISTRAAIPTVSSEFQKGMDYAAWWQGQYSTPGADQSLANLNNLGAKWLGLVATGYQETITSTTITYTLPRTPTDFDLVHAITQAHSLGMRVMLKPHLDLNNDPSHWRGQIGEGFTTEAEWQAWFASYRAFINRYAALAQANGVEQFAVGTELVGTSGREVDWRSVISDVRALYSGPITYASNHSGEETSIKWWDAVDYIGVDAYYPLTYKNDPTVAELKTAWLTPTLTLENLSNQYNKPIIFTEVGYRSVDGANQRPWEYQSGATIDLQEQADCYRAVLETFWGKPWFRGIYWWYWSTDPNQGGPGDMDYTPHNKPAETILQSYYRPSVYLPIVLKVSTYSH